MTHMQHGDGLPVSTTDLKISTLEVLRIGERFEFVTRRKLRVGDTVRIGLQYAPAYGMAVITRDLGHGGDYEAERTK